MAKKIFKEKQRFNRIEIFGLLLFFIVGLTYRFFEKYVINPNEIDINAVGFIGFILLLSVIFLYFWKLSFDITVTKKSLQYRYGFPFSKKQKIKWEDIEQYQFVETPEAVQLSGWNVQFQNDEQQFSLCGRNGIQIVTKDGKKIFLGSRRLEKLKSKITKFLRDKA